MVLQILEDIELEWSPVAASSPEGKFIQDALKHIEMFQSENERIPSFEASYYFGAAGVFNAIRDQCLAAGNRFCELGSGHGVATCLATMAGFAAQGIEIESELVVSSRKLADDFALNVQFHQGSYRTDFPIDYDLVYIYPWPAETAYITRRFEQLARPGTLLISYKGGGRFRFQRAKA